MCDQELPLSVEAALLPKFSEYSITLSIRYFIMTFVATLAATAWSHQSVPMSDASS